MTARQLEALSKVRRRRGLLHPADVVDAARPKTSPLHRYFTWDIRKAAMERLLDQARELIQVAVRIDPHLNEPVRVYVSLSKSRTRGGGYHDMSEVLGREELRRIMLMDALREFDLMRGRYAVLPELRPIFQAVESVRARISRRKAA